MKNDKKHTPGPWDAKGQRVFDSKGNPIADTFFVKESLPNAALIAAAPEMLEALEMISNEIDSFGDDLHNKIESVQLIRDLIKKARGES